MGIIQPNDFKNRRFLHFYRFFENKLHTFFPDPHYQLTFEIFLNGRKFKFYLQESISLPTGAVYLIGGRTVAQSEESISGGLNDSVLSLNNTSSNYTLATTSDVYKINLNRNKSMKIEISKSKPCPPMPEPRHNHLLIYSAPYIYVIGGKINDTTPTRSCLRFHTKQKTWSKIRDLDLAATGLTNLSGLAINTDGYRASGKRLYIFDTTVSPLPSIFQYNIETDNWMQMVISFKNKDLRIPTSLNCSLFQISSDKLMIFSGAHIVDQRQQEGFSYTFDLATEKIENFREEKQLDFMLVDKQGDRNYSKEQNVYLKFGENYAFYYNLGLETFSSRELFEGTLAKKTSFDVGCCSRKF